MARMDENVFDDCYQMWKDYSNGNSSTTFWPELANKWGYSSSEALRSHFKRERKLRGISKESNQNKSGAKILLFDLETSPITILGWPQLYNQNFRYSQVEKDWFLMSWSAKWLFEEDVYGDVLTPRETKNGNDRRIVQQMWDLMDESDIVVAHNAINFDCQKINTRFLLNGMNPPSQYRIIDTLQIARRVFGFTSNKLDDINSALGLSMKTHTDFELWKKAYQGNEDALKTLLEYNVNDVTILEELYLRLRPYITNHPNVGVYMDIEENVCKNCGSEDLIVKGFNYTNSGGYEAYRCNNCGAVGRFRENKLPKTKRRKLVS